MLKVNEIFKSKQGEGPKTGTPSLFIRLQGCNLRCSWCDSKNSINHTNGIEMTAKDIINSTDGHFTNVVITGGEPLLQQNDPEFNKLVGAAVISGLSVEIETNGTIKPTFSNSEYCIYNVSPKLSHSGMESRFNDEAMKYFAQTEANFKFVVDLENADPLYEVRAIARQYEICDDAIFIMGEGTTFEKVMENTKTLYALNTCYNVSTRAHILFKVK